MNVTGSGWQASLSLGFAPKDGRTVMGGAPPDASTRMSVRETTNPFDFGET